MLCKQYYQSHACCMVMSIIRQCSIVSSHEGIHSFRLLYCTCILYVMLTMLYHIGGSPCETDKVTMCNAIQNGVTT